MNIKFLPTLLCGAVVAFLPTAGALFDLKFNLWCNSLTNKAKALFPEGSNPSCDCTLEDIPFPISLFYGRKAIEGNCSATGTEQTVDFSRFGGIGDTKQCDANGNCVNFYFRKGLIGYDLFFLRLKPYSCSSDNCTSSCFTPASGAKWPFPSADECE